MKAEPSNPYAFVSAEPVKPSEYTRSPMSTVAALLHGIAYSLFSLFSALMFLLVLAGGLDGARGDEAALAVLLVVAGPVSAWLVLMEIGCVRVPDVRRERLLSRLAVAATTAPALLSLFWFGEYVVFGAWSLNAVPAIGTALLALLWLATALVRLVNARVGRVDPRGDHVSSNA